MVQYFWKSARRAGCLADKTQSGILGFWTFFIDFSPNERQRQVFDSPRASFRPGIDISQSDLVVLTPQSDLESPAGLFVDGIALALNAPGSFELDEDLPFAQEIDPLIGQFHVAQIPIEESRL